MSSASNHPEHTPRPASTQRSSLPALAAAGGVVALIVISATMSGDPAVVGVDPATVRDEAVRSSRAAIPETSSRSAAGPAVADSSAEIHPESAASSEATVEGNESTANLSGVVVDAAGNPVPRARVTALREIDGRCPAEFYRDHGFSDLDEVDGLRTRTEDDGSFSIDGAEPGVAYDCFVDLQGEDLWWIDACAIPVRRLVAPAEGSKLVLPYGLVIARIELPREIELLRSEDMHLDVRLRVRRGPDDESIVGEVVDRLRIAVEFDRPIEIAAEGMGLRPVKIGDVTVSRAIGRVEVPLAMESTGLAHRLTVLVTDPDGEPAPDVWVYEVASSDPPRFESLRSAGCTARDEGKFVFEFLEARSHTIVAIPDADSGLAPAGSVVDLPPSSIRELHLDVVPGEFVEVRMSTNAPKIQVLDVESQDLDFDLGTLVEWVEAGRSSWERYESFSPGSCYRSTFRLPVGRYQLRYLQDGVERRVPFEVEAGYRARVNFEFTR